MAVIPTAGVVIVAGDRVLLIEHGEGAAHITGAWGIPAGGIDPTETAREAAVRELAEETGLRVDPGVLIELPTLYEAELARKGEPPSHFSLKAFATDRFEGELTPSSEGAPAWVHVDEVANLPSLLGNTAEIVESAVLALEFGCVADATETGLGGGSMDNHLRAVSRVYGPETWGVYDLLDRSLDPRGPEVMLALATERLTPASVVLDVGCRDASHLIQLVRATGASGVGIDPLGRFVERAREAVAEASLEGRVQIAEGVMQDVPWPDGSFDLVWCRDVIEVVEPLEGAIAEVARVLQPGGHLIVYTVFATERLEPREAALLAQNLALVPANLVEEKVEAAFSRAGLAVVRKDVIGTEWQEHAEERTQPVSRNLLRLARLRRQRDRIIQDAGEEIYGHVESNLHWLVYHFLGKLLPTIYVLRRAA